MRFCPNPDGSIRDRGCGTKVAGTRELGGDVVTDLVVTR
jgi:hypothetical protein